jgi:mRNA interferase MazF
VELTVEPGAVLWASPDPSVGREQRGRRPVLVVSNVDYLETVATLALVVPLTTVDRGWDNHIRVTGEHGLGRETFAMTEQVRVVSRERFAALSGCVDAATLAGVRRWLLDYLI